MNPTHDVILSGAGPVGLFLACELALARCSVLVLERSEDPHSPLKQLPFGIRGLSAPTIEALHRRGLLSRLELHKRLKNPHKTPAPAAGPGRQAGHFAGIPFLDGNIDTSRWTDRLPSSTPPSLISEIEELETVLTRRALSLGVEIKRGLPVTGLHQTPDAVAVQSGDQTFHAKWLVGCDGSRSAVRKAAGFDFPGTEPRFTGYSTRIDLADPEKLLPGRTLTPAGMYFQSQPGYLVMAHFDGGAGHGAQPPTLEAIQHILRRVSNTDVTITALHAGTTWTDRARQASTYRIGRVLLAGDAAHIHSPLGGQGLNLGLGDAMNLGWKLAATIRGHAPASLLETYEAERHPIGAQVLDWSRAQVAVMSPGPAARALNAVLRDLIATRDGATYMAARVWGIHTQYDLGNGDDPLLDHCDDPHPLLGHSVPNFELEDGTTLADRMHDGHAILLDFTANPSLKSATAEYSTQIEYIPTHAQQNFNLTAALIRPDGIVAWATDTTPNPTDLHKAITRWFTANPPIES